MFYTFNQNNSGGSFVYNDTVCKYVIVEANTAEEANRRAETLGLYFDGKYDCPCCGNRWSEQWDSEGETEPLIYGKDPQDHCSVFMRDGEVYCRVFFADGTVQDYRGNKSEAKQQR